MVGAIIPWNAPVALICHKIGPALLAGCTVVLKSSPEAPGEGYVFAEVAEQIGLPPGVLNVVTADREVSELLVRDPGVDKITFTGSTAAGRRIASLCGERIARCTLELGGKSAAVILDDMDLGDRGEDARPRRVRAQRPGVLVADAGHRDEGSPRRARRGARGDASARRASATRSTRSRSSARSSRNASATGSWATSPRVSTRARRSPTGGGRPEGPRPRLLRGADRLRQRRQRIHDRSRGDLRAGAQRDRGGRRAGRGPDRERHDLRPQRVGVHERRRPGPRGRRSSSAPAPSATTRSAPTSACRSAGSSSRASVAKAARRACCRSSRPRP